MVEGYEGKGWVDCWIDDFDIEFVVVGNWLLVGNCCVVQWIDVDFQVSLVNCFYVDDVVEIFNIRCY